MEKVWWDGKVLPLFRGWLLTIFFLFGCVMFSNLHFVLFCNIFYLPLFSPLLLFFFWLGFFISFSSIRGHSFEMKLIYTQCRALPWKKLCVCVCLFVSEQAKKRSVPSRGRQDYVTGERAREWDGLTRASFISKKRREEK